MQRATKFASTLVIMILLASGCGGSSAIDIPAAVDAPADSDVPNVDGQSDDDRASDPAEAAPEAPDGDGSTSEAAEDGDAVDGGPTPDADEPGDAAQTIDIVSRNRYEAVTITPANGGDPLTFAVAPPSDYSEQTCQALDDWYALFNDGFAYSTEPGTSVEALAAAAAQVDAAAGGEAGIFFTERTDNIARQQAIVDAAGTADLPEEAADEVRMIESELRVFDERGISDREKHWCGPARSTVIRPDRFADVVFTAPAEVRHTDGQSVDYEALQISVDAIETSWVDPLHMVGLEDDYRVTQNPSVFVVLTATNTSSEVYEWNSLTPVELIAPRREAFRATTLYDFDDPQNPGRPFEPGEGRKIIYAIEVNVGYLQTDGTRALPADLDDWAIRFNSSGSWTYVELGGRVARGVINGNGAPWPDIDPSLYDDAADTTAVLDEPEPEPDDTDTGAEVEETLELLEGFLELTSDEVACMRVELTRAFQVLDEDTATEADFIAIYAACDLQRKALRSNLRFLIDDATASCVYDSVDNDQAGALLLEIIGLDLDEVQATMDDFVAGAGCS